MGNISSCNNWHAEPLARGYAIDCSFKAATILVIMLLLPVLSWAQAGSQDLEKVSCLELKSRVEFKEVDNRNRVQHDTIFYAPSGFLIDPEWDLDSIEGKKSLVLTYPKYTDGLQPLHNRSLTLESATPDSLPVNFPIIGLNNKRLIISKSEFDKIKKDTVYSINWRKRRNYRIVTGQLTVPFKLRPKVEETKFQMTTDVTIGTYVGLRKRLSRREPIYLVVPATLGLSFININDNTTSTGSTETTEGVFPGWTWSTGAIFQVKTFNLGVVVGRDYASKVAEDWIYHNKTWYSFAIGYSFVR